MNCRCSEPSIYCTVDIAHYRFGSCRCSVTSIWGTVDSLTNRWNVFYTATVDVMTADIMNQSQHVYSNCWTNRLAAATRAIRIPRRSAQSFTPSRPEEMRDFYESRCNELIVNFLIDSPPFDGRLFRLLTPIPIMLHCWLSGLICFFWDEAFEWLNWSIKATNL